MKKLTFKLDREADREIIKLAWPSITLKAAGDINYVMISFFLDFSTRSFMYLTRMNKGKWKYLRV